MNIRAMLVAAAMISPCGQAAADNIFQPRTTVVPDTRTSTCGSWSELRQAQSPETAVWLAWVLGFLSGVNVTSDKPDALLEADSSGVTEWLDTYCKANPLDPVRKASVKLLDQLRANAAKR
jgi:hypothetical protein